MTILRIFCGDSQTYRRLCSEKNSQTLIAAEYWMIDHPVEKHVEKFHTSENEFFGVTIQLGQERVLSGHRLE